MWIWCSNCGWHGDVPPLDVKRILREREIMCSDCETIHTLMEKEKPCIMKYPFIFEEEEMRCVVLNTLLRRKAKVWDCRPESGKCPDPIRVPKISLRPKFGDGIMFWKDRFWMLEFKFKKMRCQFDEDTQNWQVKRNNPVIEKGQSDVILNNGGLLVIMLESPFGDLKLYVGGKASKKECETSVNEVYRKQITTNKIPYEIYVLESKSYQKVLEKCSKAREWEIVKEEKRIRERMLIGYTELEQTVPDKKQLITLQEFMNGAVADLILQTL
ncbi:MAG: hypothetical protein HWN65_04430 [Candidatus Helarchaeota archaeon]|nr:hypothetical protein [Candidatus Helarchaeota archaeon]